MYRINYLKTFVSISLVAAVFLYVSCGANRGHGVSCESGITLSERYCLFASEGRDSLYVDVASKSDWSAVSDVDWIEVRKISQSEALIVSAGESSPAGRFGIVVFTSGENSDTLFVERFSNSFRGGYIDYSSHPRFLLSSPIL